MQLQEDHLWSRWVDLAFAKLDSNGDGFIDLDELIARLPVVTGTDNSESERMLAVSVCCCWLNPTPQMTMTHSACCRYGQQRHRDLCLLYFTDFLAAQLCPEGDHMSKLDVLVMDLAS